MRDKLNKKYYEEIIIHPAHRIHFASSTGRQRQGHHFQPTAEQGTDIHQKAFCQPQSSFCQDGQKILNSDYDVILANGNKLEFDKNGEWTDLDCRRGGVPAKAVPSAIKKFVKTKHPNATIVSLERDHDSYEVKLSNAWEIKFDKQFNVTDMSMDD